MQTSRLWIVALVATAAVAFAPGRAAAELRGFDPDTVYKVPVGAAPQRGPASAPVTIVAWSDFACRFCNRVEATLEQLDRLYPGQLRWVFRHLPLDPDDPLAAEASLAAAAQGRFWPMKARLFALRGKVDRPIVEMIAGELGLDLVRFRGDLDAGAYRAQVAADVAAAQALGVTGTPTFFVNGRPIRGNQALGTFTAVVDAELARAAAAGKTGVAGAGLYDHLVGTGVPAADAELVPATVASVELDRTALYKMGLGLPGHSAGPDDALVTVVVWSDFECGYCTRNLKDLARLREEHPADVRIVFRHMPLSFHEHAQLAAEAGVAAAAQGKFWAFHDRAFSADGALDRAALERIAKDAGIDLARFRAALDDRRYHDAVAAEAAAGSELGISGTPTMFVNGSPIIGAAGWDVIGPMVAAHLSAAQQMVAHGLERRDVYGMVMLSGGAGERSDPSRIPRPGEHEVKLELGPVEREAAVIAACRGRDGARAGELAGRLTGDRRANVDETCAAIGVDLKK
jgi:protein-disulfide isomerase